MDAKERKVWMGHMMEYWPNDDEYYTIYSRCSTNDGEGWYVELEGKRATFMHPVQDNKHAEEMVKSLYPEAVLVLVYYE